MEVQVTASGAVCLGKAITCDGFLYDYPIRVQTHIHSDHLNDFETSKGFQHIVLSHATRDFLILQYDAELPYRENIQAIPFGKILDIDGHEIKLLDSGHMLGAAQVKVVLPNGLRCGYSGDISWPLEEVVQVDELVLDTTSGGPGSIRLFTQEEALERFIQIVSEHILQRSIYIKAHRGTLERALSSIDGEVKAPIIASPRMCSEIEVYRSYGHCTFPVYKSNDPETKQIMKEERYIRVFGMREKYPGDTSQVTSITLSAYMHTGTDKPVLNFSPISFSIAFTSHADFNELLEYVSATGAQTVLTDNTRGGHAIELAVEIRRRLGINAIPSDSATSLNWGD